MNADAAPKRVEVRASGWRVDSSNCLTEDGALRGNFERSCRELRFSLIATD